MIGGLAGCFLLRLADQGSSSTHRRARGREVRVLRGRADGDRARAAAEEVGEPEGQLLDAVGAEAELVREHRVVRRPVRALQPRVRVQEKVVAVRVADPGVDDGAGEGVAAPVVDRARRGQEARLVALLDGDKGNRRSVVGRGARNLGARGAQRGKLVLEDLAVGWVWGWV